MDHENTRQHRRRTCSCHRLDELEAQRSQPRLPTVALSPWLRNIRDLVAASERRRGLVRR